MAFNIGGIQVQGSTASIIQNNKQAAEQAVNALIQEAKNDPAKSVREIQQPSPFSQFLDIKA